MFPHNKPLQLAISAALFAGAAVLEIAQQQTEKIPYHTSILTGHKWLVELFTTENRHRFHEQLGVHLDTFIELVKELEAIDVVKNTAHISTEEQVAIFLYTAVTNLPNRKVAERFQRSGETISR
jgi:hypothetical protein